MRQKSGTRISPSHLGAFLKIECGLVYKRVLPISSAHNSHRNLLLRQYAAAKYIDALAGGRTIINIDESVIRVTDSRRRGWIGIRRKNIQSSSLRLKAVNVIAAVASTGEVYYTINQGKTNSWTLGLFLQKLAGALDSTNPNWRGQTTLLFDTAPYHRSTEAADILRGLNLHAAYLGPYQFKMAPAELLFSFIKNRDINPLSIRGHSRYALII